MIINLKYSSFQGFVFFVSNVRPITVALEWGYKVQYKQFPQPSIAICMGKGLQLLPLISLVSLVHQCVGQLGWSAIRSV